MDGRGVPPFRWPTAGSTVVAVSPHLDDAVFSAGALICELVAGGVDVVVVTVFTGNVERPQGFALACQTDKGLPPDLDYMALRRAEDLTALGVLGARAVHLPLLEAPHRGYGEPAALFGPVRDDDPVEPQSIAREVQASLSEVTDRVDLVLGPAALGDHVDHRHVHDALNDLAVAVGAPLHTWADLPYAMRLDRLPPDFRPRPATDDSWTPKLRACSAYASQLRFQFGDVQRMADALRSTAEAFSAVDRWLQPRSLSRPE